MQPSAVIWQVLEVHNPWHCGMDMQAWRVQGDLLQRSGV